MGSGSFSFSDYSRYSRSMGKSVDTATKRVSGQTYTAVRIDKSLDPKNVVRECANNDEHPNTVPVILALDVTGSMGAACKETAEALGVIMTNLYDKFKDIEFCVMGIGDLAYDRAPIQMSQFESDVRIAEALDKLYMEHGGGGNGFESYTAAWYMGLRYTKLDAFDKQGRKGIIITMGDEPLNPYLPAYQLANVTGDSLQKDVNTNDLYKQVVDKFDIFHIAIKDPSSAYNFYDTAINRSFGKVLGDRLKVFTIQELPGAICSCIEESINGSSATCVDANGTISW